MIKFINTDSTCSTSEKFGYIGAECELVIFSKYVIGK